MKIDIKGKDFYMYECTKERIFYVFVTSRMKFADVDKALEKITIIDLADYKFKGVCFGESESYKGDLWNISGFEDSIHDKDFHMIDLETMEELYKEVK